MSWRVLSQPLPHKQPNVTHLCCPRPRYERTHASYFCGFRAAHHPAGTQPERAQAGYRYRGCGLCSCRLPWMVGHWACFPFGRVGTGIPHHRCDCKTCCVESTLLFRMAYGGVRAIRYHGLPGLRPSGLVDFAPGRRPESIGFPTGKTTRAGSRFPFGMRAGSVEIPLQDPAGGVLLLRSTGAPGTSTSTFTSTELAILPHF